MIIFKTSLLNGKTLLDRWKLNFHPVLCFCSISLQNRTNYRQDHNSKEINLCFLVSLRQLTVQKNYATFIHQLWSFYKPIWWLSSSIALVIDLLSSIKSYFAFVTDLVIGSKNFFASQWKSCLIFFCFFFSYLYYFSSFRFRHISSV